MGYGLHSFLALYCFLDRKFVDFCSQARRILRLKRTILHVPIESLHGPDGDGRGGWPPAAMGGVVEAFAFFEGVGRHQDAALGAADHERVLAAGGKDVGIMVAVEDGPADWIGVERSRELRLDPRLARRFLSQPILERPLLIGR